MSICKDIKGFSRTHEHIADFFSLLAVGVLFGAIWATVAYYQQLSSWLRHDWLLHGGLLIGGLIFIGFLVLGLLAVGSSRFAGEDEKCFGTFRGRRNYNGSPVRWFTTWVSHMENVGKKHR